MNSVDMGSATIGPEGTFPVFQTGTWTVTYTVGRFGIDDGGSIMITRRAMSDATRPQCDDPRAPGYVTACTNGEGTLEVWYENRYWIRPHRGAIVVRVFDGSLAPGDEITVTIGDRSGGSPGWTLQTFPETAHEFRVLVDAFGTREYYPVAKHPSIRIVPGKPAKLDAVLPSTARPGQEVPLWIRVTDEWDNPLTDFSGEIRIEHEGEQGAETFEIHQGVAKVGPIRLPNEGVYRLALSCGALRGTSNPVSVCDGAEPVFWADLHGQTEHTVGTGSVEEYLSFARDKALIDATSWQGNDFQVTDATWQEVCEQTRKFNEPGRFVTFLGYEWSGLTPAGGDHNILYLHDDQTIHRSSHWQIHDGSSDETDRYPVSALWSELKGRQDVMAIGHVGGRYANLDFWEPEICKLIEIHSHHGTFEWLAEDALRRGLVVGFVAQSDDHSGRPGLSAPLKPLARDFATFDVYGGYTGIYARELTREALWEALQARHCFATTGKRILLDVRCGDHLMGDVIEQPDPLELAVRIVATAPILDVEIRRDAEVIYRHPFPVDPNDTWVRLEWSGVRIRSRAKKADWDGTIRVHDGTIEEFRPFAFDQRDEGLEQLSGSELKVVSTTSGDVDGVFLKVAGESPSVEFECEAIRQQVSVGVLGPDPLVFDAGGVNREVRFSLCSFEGRPEQLELTYQPPRSPAGAHAYWVKLVQLDGHMAWSSPIFVH